VKLVKDDTCDQLGHVYSRAFYVGRIMGLNQYNDEAWNPFVGI
jgi:hypothetical protein